MQAILGLVVLVAIAWGVGERRREVHWRVVPAGLAVQFAFALLILQVAPVREAFIGLNRVVEVLSGATLAGTSMVFGYAGGGPAPFEVTDEAAFFVLGFQALPLILVVSALSALLWHWRLLPLVIRGFAWLLRRSMGIGGAVGVASAANILMGMVEAPLLIRPYVARLSRSDLFVVMSVGMATIGGTVMVLYATVLGSTIDGALGHILAASIISVPAAVMLARVMVPPARDEEAAPDEGPGVAYDSSMDAITQGTQAGLTLLLNVIALLIVLVAIVALVNTLLGFLPPVMDEALTLQRIFGWVFAPLVWLAGVPWSEAMTAGALMGTKTVLNEFLAYLDLAALPGDALSPQSRLIMLYALCGFANPGSLGIMIGGLAGMAPDRRAEIAELGLRSVVSGTLATLMTGAIVGLLTTA